MTNVAESETIFRKNPQFVARTIADELVLIPLQRHLEDVNSLYSLNALGREVWELLDGKNTVTQIRETLLSQYEVDSKILDEDLALILEQLESIKAIQAS